MASTNGQLVTVPDNDQGAPDEDAQLLIRQSTTPIDQTDLFRAYDSPSYVWASGAIPSSGVSPVLIGRRCV